MLYVFYNEQELWMVHMTFSHPSGRSSEMLLKRAEQSNLDKETISVLKKIKEEIVLCRNIE